MNTWYSFKKRIPKAGKRGFFSKIHFKIGASETRAGYKRGQEHGNNGFVWLFQSEWSFRPWDSRSRMDETKSVFMK
jgi:hypothetical protein